MIDPSEIKTMENALEIVQGEREIADLEIDELAKHRTHGDHSISSEEYGWMSYRDICLSAKHEMSVIYRHLQERLKNEGCEGYEAD
jgi:hypothetical protein